MTAISVNQRLKLAGMLILAGLAIELVTLLWSHPTAFLAFLILGGACLAAGTAFFLYSLVA